MTHGKAVDRVALLVDAETGTPYRSGFRVDAGGVEAQVLAALRRQCSHVAVMPYDEQALCRLEVFKPQVVFNLTEWIDGERGRDHEIVAALQRAGFRYTGADARCLKRCRDKPAVNRLLARDGVVVPRHFVIEAGAHIPPSPLPYPLFVKPARGDGSDHIVRKSLVRDAAALRERVRVLRARRVGAILCEEYIDGRDVFVALLGRPLRALTPLVLSLGGKGSRGHAPPFATAALKHSPRAVERWQVAYSELALPAAALKQMARQCERIGRLLGLTGYARLDFRLAPDGSLVFLEANPNPDLGRHTFGRERCFPGVAYPELIRRILTAGLAPAGVVRTR